MAEQNSKFFVGSHPRTPISKRREGEKGKDRGGRMVLDILLTQSSPPWPPMPPVKINVTSKSQVDRYIYRNISSFNNI
jgi:hypothetical protein